VEEVRIEQVQGEVLFEEWSASPVLVWEGAAVALVVPERSRYRR
jgi:hypothetical protein